MFGGYTMDNKRGFVVIVIPLSEVKKFIAIDLVGGTLLYYVLKLPLHSVYAAMAGSMVGPYLIRLSVKRNRRK
jgi:hypothetical protein